LHAWILILLLAVTAFAPALSVWPFPWLIPLAGYAVLVAMLPPLRMSFRPWHFGRISRPALIATATITLGSCLVLVTFQLLTHPDVSFFSRFLPVSALGGVVVFGVLFPVFNALFEEIVFRGILFDAVESQWGQRIAILGTAIVFGYGHMRGYPPGALGALLAGIYGICLGWLRVFSRGLGLPVIAHVAADATIFVILVRSGAS